MSDKKQVWPIFTGQYSDICLEEVWSNREDAEKRIAYLNSLHDSRLDEYWIGDEVNLDCGKKDDNGEYEEAKAVVLIMLEDYIWRDSNESKISWRVLKDDIIYQAGKIFLTNVFDASEIQCVYKRVDVQRNYKFNGRNIFVDEDPPKHFYYDYKTIDGAKYALVASRIGEEHAKKVAIEKYQEYTQIKAEEGAV